MLLPSGDQAGSWPAAVTRQTDSPVLPHHGRSRRHLVPSGTRAARRQARRRLAIVGGRALCQVDGARAADTEQIHIRLARCPARKHDLTAIGRDVGRRLCSRQLGQASQDEVSGFIRRLALKAAAGDQPHRRGTEHESHDDGRRNRRQVGWAWLQDRIKSCAPRLVELQTRVANPVEPLRRIFLEAAASSRRMAGGRSGGSLAKSASLVRIAAIVSDVSSPRKGAVPVSIS